MNKKIALATLAALPISAGSAYACSMNAVVTTDYLNIRSNPGTNNKVLFSLRKNENVQINESYNGWYKIKTREGKEGWAYSKYISLDKESSPKENIQSQNKEIVNIDGLNIRSGPSTSYRTIGKLDKGTMVEVISKHDEWAKIRYNKRLGYVYSIYLDEIINKNNNETIKKVNYDFLNVRDGASTQNSIIGRLKRNDKISVLSENNGWSKIDYNGKIAYVSSRYLSEIQKERTSSNESDKVIEHIIYKKIVNISYLNVRDGAGTNCKKIGTLRKNEDVDIYSESNGWSKINYNGKVAYVYSEYLSDNSQGNNNDSENSSEIKETKFVNYEFLNVRSGAGTSYSKLGKLYKNDKVKVYSESNGWSKIDYSGKIAYVSSRYLDEDKSNDSQENNKNDTEIPSKAKIIKFVNYDFLNVRNGAGTNYTKVGILSKNEKVQVYSQNDGWSQINYRGNKAYVSSMYLSDTESDLSGGDISTSIDGSTIVYKNLSYSLKSHVKVQLERSNLGGNVISSSSKRGFVKANESDLEYYLNPNNFIGSTKGMMQFLRIDSYKGGISASELNSYLNSLRAPSLGRNVFYNQGQSFINAAKKYDIDLVYLVSHSMWETAYGRSTLAQGQVLTSYKGKPLEQPVKVYNFFGIGAIDHSANLSGAEAAYSNGWTSVEATIDGSAKWIARGYIKNSRYKQNTIYKMKYNYEYPWHQYATDINWPNGISNIMANLIRMYDTKSNLTFEIPKYR